jgi:Antibiotic biosynthesis monooxygenase
MSEILSMAVMEPFEGKEAEFKQVLTEFYAMLGRKNYSRDELLRSAKDGHYVNIRHWSSEAARDHAHEDPDVHRYWAKIGLLCQMRVVYEQLEPIIQGAAAKVE